MQQLIDQPTADERPADEVIRDAVQASVKPVTHRSWCVPGMCRRDPVGDGTTHYSAVYQVPRGAALSDTFRVQVWSPDDTLGESEADATFFEVWIVNRRGETLHSVDLRLSQVLVLRALLGVVNPDGEASNYGYNALRPGSMEARQAADAQLAAVETAAFAVAEPVAHGLISYVLGAVESYTCRCGHVCATVEEHDEHYATAVRAGLGAGREAAGGLRG